MLSRKARIASGNKKHLKVLEDYLKITQGSNFH